jgi:ubiquilin
MANAATFSVEVDFSATVAELKAQIASSDKADCEPERQKLVYKGKILKDDDTLESYGTQSLYRDVSSPRLRRNGHERASVV